MPPRDLAAEALEHARTLHGKLDTTNQLLMGLLRAIGQRPQPFTADCVNGGFIAANTTTGVVRFVNNPTGAPVTLTIVEGGNPAGPPRFSQTLAPGAAFPVFVVFKSGLFCTSGAGAVVHGEFDA